MSRDRGLGRTRGKSQSRSQTRGRLKTQAMREKYDELDFLEGFILLQGKSHASADAGIDDDLFSSLMLDEMPDSDDQELVGEDDSPSDDSLRRQLFGSRTPTILIATSIEDGRVRAFPLIKSRSQETQEALAELVALTEQVFDDAAQHLSADDWRMLVGKNECSVSQRLVLLCRIAIAAGKRVSTTSYGEYRPSDRELSRYRHKLASLPDGTPFNLGLLLRDERGRKRKRPSEESGIGALPDVVKLLALRRAREIERSNGQALIDVDFSGLIRKALMELLTVDPLRRNPSDGELTNLRERLKRRGLHGEFPNRKQRQQEYDRLVVGR